MKPSACPSGEQRQRSRSGFTLVELAVVVVIIGVLASFGVPRFLDAVERSKASEAFGYLSSLRAAQERYIARQGEYASTLSDLDIQFTHPKYFDYSCDISTALGDTGGSCNWSYTLTRSGASAGYGSYTVTFNQMGFDPSSTIADLDHSHINPLATQ